MDKTKAKRILRHLLKHNLGWCFVDGMVIDRDYLTKILKK